MAAERWLEILTQLSVQGDYQGLVARCRAHLDALDEAGLGLAARAALEVGDEDVLDAAVNRLQQRVPAGAVTVHMELCQAVHRRDRATVARVQRRIADYATLVEQPAVREAASLHLRAHAWADLDDLLARCRAAADPLPRPLLRAQAVLHLRRRAFQQAIDAASDAFHAADRTETQVAGVLLARCLERAGEVDRAARTYKQAIWQAPPHPRYHYRAALAAVRAERYPVARHFMQRATNAGAKGPWMEWIRGYVKLRFKSADKALAIFHELCQREPDNISFALAWLDAFDADQPPSRTLEQVNRLLDEFDTPALRVRRIDLLLSLGEVDAARAESEDAQIQFPESSELADSQQRVTNADASASTVTNGDADATDRSGQAIDRAHTAAVELSSRRGPPPVSQWPEAFQPRWSGTEIQGRAGFLEGLGTQLRVVHALMLREIQTRFGRAKLGYLWAFLEPALHMAVFYTLWSFRGRATMDGLPLELFLITGFVPWFTFSQTYSNCIGAVKGSASLLSHPTITPFDLLMVKAVLEGLTRASVLVLFLSLAWLAGLEFQIHDPGLILLTFGMLWISGLGLGCIIEAFSTFVATLPKVMNMVMRFFYFTSGVMFPISTMPPSVQEILYWNPLVHLITTIRYSFTQVPVLDWITLSYPLMFMAGWLFFGLVAMRALQRRVTSA
jgi:capsular polysaccharide transport system permease protein